MLDRIMFGVMGLLLVCAAAVVINQCEIGIAAAEAEADSAHALLVIGGAQ